MTAPYDWIGGELARLESALLLRRSTQRAGAQGARITLEDGRALINFGSNDYLGLAGDPRLLDAAARAARREGWGSGASPLVTGHSRAHTELEETLAHFEHAEAALLFPTGFAANLGVIPALAGRGDVILSDAKNHASIIDGCRLSRAEVLVYPHADCEAAEDLLRRAGAKFRRRVIVTDGLFSMDGDLAPLAELAELARRNDAMLLVDEAHATGVFGAGGRGACEAANLGPDEAIRVGTLSKALGSAGGFVVGPGPVIEWVRNRARSYVFSTAMPPAVAAASLAALRIVIDEPHRRRELLARADALRNALLRQGWNLGASASQIIPLVVGEPKEALRLAAALRERGLLVPAIRPPTVPEGESLLRISLSFLHDQTMVDRLLAALGERCD